MSESTRALMDLCAELFGSNAVGTDFSDVQVIPVTKRPFPQQPGGEGLHISFSVSWHMIGKTGEKAHDALSVLVPEAMDSDEEQPG